jgi:hypothetical protein
MVTQHVRWIECLDEAHRVDAATPTAPIAHREATRFLSNSQPAAGAALEVSPDGTYGTTISSLNFAGILQYRGGLDLAEAIEVNRWRAESGQVSDPKGDTFANGGEYNRRHNVVNRAGYDMVSAAAIGPVVLGDKTDRDKTAALCETHTVDVAEIGGDDATGGDVLIETKVPSPLTRAKSAGKGSKDGGGKPAKVGHQYAFGNTEEPYRVLVLGCKKRGAKSQGPFNHYTGRGYVKAMAGQYADALSKGSRVVPLIVETLGGITPHALSYVRYLDRRTRGRGKRDSTAYGRSRTSARTFYTHHTQRISLAAQRGNVQAIRAGVRAAKHAHYAGARA